MRELDGFIPTVYKIRMEVQDGALDVEAHVENASTWGVTFQVDVYRGQREMLTAALPACIAMVYVKNSGLFFAAATLLIVYLRAGDRRRARRAVPAGAAGVALSLIHISSRHAAARSSRPAKSSC